mgnify:CR=1 FL=1
MSTRLELIQRAQQALRAKQAQKPGIPSPELVEKPVQREVISRWERDMSAWHETLAKARKEQKEAWASFYRAKKAQKRGIESLERTLSRVLYERKGIEALLSDIPDGSLHQEMEESISSAVAEEMELLHRIEGLKKALKKWEETSQELVAAKAANKKVWKLEASIPNHFNYL